MRQVLIVAPQFPPSNLQAVHRNRYLATHLPKFGWKVKVLTVKPAYYEEKLDYELEKLLPLDLEVIRTPAFPIKPLRLIGDISLRALWWHYAKICSLAKKEKIDILYISIPPNYSSLLGPLIFRRFGIPYVLDYQDPWVPPQPTKKKFLSKHWFSERLAYLFEPWVLRKVSFITAVAEGYYKVAIMRYPWLDSACCLALPIGIDEEDFRYLDTHPRPPYIFDPRDGNFNFVYAGAMLPYAYAIFEILFKALVIFRDKFPSFFKRLRFYFIGTGKSPNDTKGFNVKPLADRYHLSDVVFEHPHRIPYLDVLNHLKNASAILILGSVESYYTPSKVFQAVLAKRPIIAILHKKSSAIEVLKNRKATAKVITFDETAILDETGYIEKIIQAIQEISNVYSSEENINWQGLEEYRAQKITQRMAELFENILKSKKSDDNG